MTGLGDRDALRDFGPLAERALSVTEDAMIRLRSGQDTISGYVRLPFDVLAGRTVRQPGGPADVAVSARDFLRWLDDGADEPARKDAHWLSALPPRTGWRRIELVPDSVVRELVRSGAQLAPTASSRPGQQALLESVVLSAHAADGELVEVPLGPLSALTRMGFLPPDGHAAIDTAPGWIRVAAAYGSTFISAGKDQLGLLRLS